MTADFWKQIQPQLDEQISNVLGDTMPASELLTIITKPFWWDAEPFKSMKVWYENADQTFLQWMNCCEAFMGSEIEKIFDEELRKRIADTIEAQEAARLKDLIEAYTAEMKEVAA